MSPVIEFHGFSLEARGPVLSGGVRKGGKLAVVGALAEGKSRLLRAFAGLERPARGRVVVNGEPVLAGLPSSWSRATPQTLAKRLAGPSGAGPAAEALTACRLWDVRQGSIGSLRQERQAACALLPCLLSRAGLMVIDGLLDRLDPWTRNDVLGLIETKLGAGASLALSTNDLGLAESCDDLIVLRGDSIAYFGPLKALLAEFGPDILEVETDNRPGVKALVDPVVAEVEECETGLRLKVRDGMETAVRLLLQGYGDVKIVAVRRPRLKDVLMERFGV